MPNKQLFTDFGRTTTVTSLSPSFAAIHKSFQKKATNNYLNLPEKFFANFIYGAFTTLLNWQQLLLCQSEYRQLLTFSLKLGCLNQ